MDSRYMIPQDYFPPALIKEGNNPLSELFRHPVLTIGAELLVNKALDVKKTSHYCDIYKETSRAMHANASDWLRYRLDDHNFDCYEDGYVGEVSVNLRLRIRSY